MLPVEWALMGVGMVLLFFIATNRLTVNWAEQETKRVRQKLFVYSLVLRLCWVTGSYFLYFSTTGKPFEFAAADSVAYHDTARWLSSYNPVRVLKILVESKGGGVSDVGYTWYLTLLYSLVGTELLIPRIIKAVLSAYMVVLVHKLAQRNFGEDVARMAGVLTMLMPNLIYYNGLHLKESEMVFITVWFIERADALFRSSRMNLRGITTVLLLTGVLFTFRTVLGITAIFSVSTALLLSKKSNSNTTNRLFFMVWVVLASVALAGGRIAGEIEEIWESRNQNQQRSYEWRSSRRDGNAFARYASTAYLAPTIFIVPFPTMVKVDTQQNQMLLHGGNYVKNVMAFFVFVAFLRLIKHQKWRDHLLLLTFTMGYLIIVAFSSFAHSERFHLPALPLLLILSAYGIENMTPSLKRLFTPYLVLLMILIAGWSWFKLAGRGLV